MVTPEEVSKILRRLCVNKAPDKTGMSNRALRLLLAIDGETPVFEHHLSNLSTACLYKGIFPDAWKTAVTHLVPKAGKDRYDLIKSWRPIALLSVVSKVLEKVLANRVTSITLDHNLLKDCKQYAFSGRSTEEALYQNFEYVFDGWASGFKVSQLFLDMMGAYDRVIRQKLLEILARKSLPDLLVDILCFYLSGRLESNNIHTWLHYHPGISYPPGPRPRQPDIFYSLCLLHLFHLGVLRKDSAPWNSGWLPMLGLRR